MDKVSIMHGQWVYHARVWGPPWTRGLPCILLENESTEKQVPWETSY